MEEMTARTIIARLWWMDENYHGCDWCCGGGDEEKARLLDSLKVLGLSDETIKQIEPTEDEVEAAGQTPC